jgi:N-acyl-D-amino-acid deacylase
MDYDLKITGGTIIDGTGSPAREGDVAIKDGKIAAVGEAPGKAAATIEARGRVVAPGFVDIHTHYDAQILWDRMTTISPWHGVTTVVMGNCGFGVAPTRPKHRGLIMRTLEKVEGMSLDALEAGLGYEWPFETFEQYLDAVEKRGSAINVGALIGHTPTRLYVMGEESVERPANEAEIAEMREIVRRGIRAGAVGFATSKSPTHVGYSGKPVPSRKAEMNEITALASVLAEENSGVIQATVGRELFLKEFVDLFRATGRTITWTALLAGMTGSNDGHRRLLEQSEELSGQGMRIVPQVACRPLNFEMTLKEPFIFESLSVFKQISEADFDGKTRIYADPEFRAMFKSKMGINSAGRFADRWERSWVSYYPGHPELEESNLAELARARGIDPIDLMLDIGLETKLEARFRMALFNYEEDEVIALLNGKGTVVGLSDAGAHASQLCDACFSTYLMGHWVRERKAIPIERAVWMLTARPAEVFALSDRGRLVPGLAGDVVIFDPDKIGCSRLRRVNDLPSGADRLVADAYGIDAVIVNGKVIRREGHDTVAPDGPLPGRLLRHGHASA